MSSDPIDFRLEFPAEDATEEVTFETIKAVVDGTCDVPTATAKIHDIVMTQLNADLAAYHDPANLRLPPGDENRVRGPMPKWRREDVFSNLCRAAWTVPYDHPAQDRLVDFLDSLCKLPQTMVEVFDNDGPTSTHIDLWGKTPHGHSIGLESQWELISWQFGASQMQGQDQEDCVRQLNWTSWQARLLGRTVVNTTDQIHVDIPGLPGLPNGSFEIMVRTATQWILYAAPGIYELCKSRVGISGTKRITLKMWERWKWQFGRVADVKERPISDETRQVAAEARRRMEEVEAEGVTTNLAETWGLERVVMPDDSDYESSWEGDTDEEDEEDEEEDGKAKVAGEAVDDQG